MEDANKSTNGRTALPPDDARRALTVADPDGPGLQHVAVVGDTYTILVSGADTAGKYCLIDMTVPLCGGPGPHRHDFEEMFTILEGEIEFTFRGEKRRIKTGTTINIPANAPHFFTNVAGQKARMHCMCAPAGQDEFFLAIGQRVPTRTTPAPPLDERQQADFMRKAQELAPVYRTELLPPAP